MVQTCSMATINQEIQNPSNALERQVQALVDNGSSTDILYYLAFQQMKVDRECLLPLDAPLVGFDGTKVFPVGTITLLVTIRTYP